MSQKILIVEDDQSLYKALTERFEREGYSVLGAKNGEEGLSIALEEKPVLILLDIIMPKKDGISMLADLRKDEWGKNVPVIMLSNLSDTEKMAEAAE
ncbi:MAG: response regulator, partial [Candidatus Jacksonbacteria bacterium]|nr:response regulator [Candidatus Jacksonbacteria bacterium]